ncbi:hypothetical protein HDV00_011202 [Rhizophlyctis rosea]|nr:hypothetical protein HDV00_011202 [Rhizophlyctis rosea]
MCFWCFGDYTESAFPNGGRWGGGGCVGWGGLGLGSGGWVGMGMAGGGPRPASVAFGGPRERGPVGAGGLEDEGAVGYKQTLARLQQMFKGYNDPTSTAPADRDMPSQRTTMHVPPSGLPNLNEARAADMPRPVSMATAEFASRLGSSGANGASAYRGGATDRTQTVAELKERLARMKQSMNPAVGQAPTE